MVNITQINRVNCNHVTMPASGTIKIGTGVLNTASITSIGTIGAKLTANKAAAITAIATADATDLATALVLINAIKAKINEIITGQKTALQML